tara:strand:+ start:1271 stop:1378 length:108 start_codon:yes stop_codon:yes gene_type:complete
MGLKRIDPMDTNITMAIIMDTTTAMGIQKVKSKFL